MSAHRVAVLYAAIMGAWIIVSTLLAGWLTSETLRLTQLLMLNGMLVVGTSSLFVYTLLRLEARERRRLRDELSGADERIRMLVDNAPVGIATVHNGSISYANHRYAAIYGYSAAQLLGRPLVEQLAPRARAELAEAPAALPGRSEHSRRSRQPTSAIETIGLRADGSEFPLRIEVARLELPNGLETIVFAEDIAARREAEAALRLTQFAVDNAWDAILTVRADGSIQDANDAACRRLGFSRDELRQMSLWDVDPGCPRVGWAVHWSEVKRRGDLTRETVLRARTGRSVPVEFAVTFLSFEGAEYYVASARDITEHKRLHRQLTAARDAYMTLVEEARILVWRTDGHGRCDFVNKHWTQLTSFSTSTALGMGWVDQVHHDDRQATVGAMQRAFTAQEPFDVEFRLQHPHGGLHWMTMRAAPFYNDRGRFAGFVGTCVDITERKLQELVKDDFLALASHELKTPLAALLGYADLLQRWSTQQQFDERVETALHSIIAEGAHLDRLVNDLLDVNRITSGELSLRCSEFELAELVEQAAAVGRELAPEHRWEVTIEAREPVLVCADRRRIEQVLENLVANAAKYSLPGEPIGIKLRADDTHASIAVVDHGVGIPATDLPFIFDRFYQVRRPARESRPGLGLGLFISHEIVLRHGGTIVVSSNEQNGSSFTVVLPRVDKQREESSLDETYAVRSAT